MAGMLIKQLPPGVHRKLKAAAAEHHRSMAKEALVLIEHGLMRTAGVTLPPPYKGRFPITQAWLTRAIRQGRM